MIADLNNFTDNKEFWKTVKPFLSDKVTTFLKISLAENDEILDESKVANYLVISLQMLSIHLVSKQTNIQMITTV